MHEQNFHEVQETLANLRIKVGSRKPQIGIVLGTGLSGLASKLTDTLEIPYEELPNFTQSTVHSHVGRFVLGKLNYGDNHSVEVIIQDGRCHLYEGNRPSAVCIGIRTMATLGIHSLIISNAAGALNPQFDTGDLMMITDQINLTGKSPLVGENFEQWGERFIDMSKVYDPEYQELCLKSAKELGIRLERGVFVQVLGPQLETPAETRYLRTIGADAVAMSTAIEVIAARHLGLRVLGISCLTNKNLPDCMAETSLEEIINAANSAEKKFSKLIQDMIFKIAK